MKSFTRASSCVVVCTIVAKHHMSEFNHICLLSSSKACALTTRVTEHAEILWYTVHGHADVCRISDPNRPYEYRTMQTPQASVQLCYARLAAFIQCVLICSAVNSISSMICTLIELLLRSADSLIASTALSNGNTYDTSGLRSSNPPLNADMPAGQVSRYRFINAKSTSHKDMCMNGSFSDEAPTPITSTRPPRLTT